MSESSPIQLVCFDLGGVVIRICRTWLDGLGRADLPVRDGLQVRLDHALENIRGLIYQHQTGRMTGDAYYANFSNALDELYTPEEVERVHMAWIIDQYSGVHAVVEAINRAGLTTAALSNTNAAHWDEIGTFSAVQLLHHRFASHLIGEHKPDAAAYEHVERALDIRGETILFFDDLAENVAAARDRGWNAVQIDHAGDTAAQMQKMLSEFGVVV